MFHGYFLFYHQYLKIIQPYNTKVFPGQVKEIITLSCPEPTPEMTETSHRGYVHTNVFLFENALFSLCLGLPFTLRWCFR